MNMPVENMIIGPRHIDNKTHDKGYNELKEFGNKSGGIKIWITRKGILINGYYQGLRDRVNYRNMKDDVIITWEELDEIRNRVTEIKRNRR